LILANDYFQEVQYGGSQTQSDNLLEKIAKLKYTDGDQKIEMILIDDNFTSSIFIGFDDQAEQFWNSIDKEFNRMFPDKKFFHQSVKH